MQRFFFLLVLLVNFSSWNRMDGNPAVNEKITVQTDRDIYIAGENLFFSLSINSTYTLNKGVSNFAYLVLRDTRNNYKKLYIKLDNQASFGCIYLPDTLKTGFYQIVSFTNYMRNFGESEFATKQIIIVNRFDKTLNAIYNVQNSIDRNSNALSQPETLPLKISLEKDSFRTRELIKIKITPDKDLENRFIKIISISVKESNPFSQELKSSSDEVLTNKNLQNNIVKEHHIKETNGIFLEGKILAKDSLPVKNECMLLSVVDTIPNLQYSFTNEDGDFQFLLTDFYQQKPSVISRKDNDNEEYRISINNKFQLNESFIPNRLAPKVDLRKYIFESQQLVTLHKSYATNFTKDLSIPNTISHTAYVYTEPSASIFPSNYSDLKDIQEIADNIIPDFKIKRNESDYYPYVVNSATHLFFQSPASIFLNGIPIPNLNLLMNWNPSDFLKIELCKDLRVKGKISFTGIISIKSNKKIDPLVFLPHAASFDMGKFCSQITYNAPKYSSVNINDHLPDFRQLLYWNPSFILNNESMEVDFFSSDWTGNYIIELTGTDKEGKTYKTYSEIKVYE